MAATREDLRDHLLAVLAASAELPREDRTYLADTFLNELDAKYELVPKTGWPGRATSPAPRRSGPIRPRRGWWPAVAMAALIVLFVAAMLPLLAFGHPPIFLLAIVFFVLMRLRGPWMWRRRSYR